MQTARQMLNRKMSNQKARQAWSRGTEADEKFHGPTKPVPVEFPDDNPSFRLSLLSRVWQAVEGREVCTGAGQ